MEKNKKLRVNQTSNFYINNDFLSQENIKFVYKVKAMSTYTNITLTSDKFVDETFISHASCYFFRTRCCSLTYALNFIKLFPDLIDRIRINYDEKIMKVYFKCNFVLKATFMQKLENYKLFDYLKKNSFNVKYYFDE